MGVSAGGVAVGAEGEPTRAGTRREMDCEDAGGERASRGLLRREAEVLADQLQRPALQHVVQALGHRGNHGTPSGGSGLESRRVRMCSR